MDVRRTGGVVLAMLTLAAGAASGCGGQVTAEAAERSQRKYEVAVGLFQTGDQPSALRTLYEAIELDPSNYDAELLLGNVFLLRKDFNRSEEHLRRALELRPDSHEAKNSIAVLEIHRRRYDSAIRILRELTQDPLTQEVHLAWGNLGWAELEKGNTAAAIEALRHAVQEERRFCVGHYRLGDAYYRTQQYDEAEKSLTSAVAPDVPGCAQLQDAQRLLGLTRVRLQKRAEAAEAFQACVALDAESAPGRECATYLRGLE